ncbi:MAG TPA: sensor histidine kinase [Chloroflexota bacterium]|nr:sensor histidine kinase [Chloroflexota bacterium]
MSGSALAVAWPADDFQAPESAPPRPWWTPISRANLRGAALQWATGLFCAFIGAQMLVVPHQFGAQAYDTLRPNMLVWGTATLLAGMAMIVVAATGGSRKLAVAAHVAVGAVLLLLAGELALTGGRFVTTIYGTLGVGTALAPLVTGGPRAPVQTSDLFAIVIGVAVALIGAMMLAFPEQFVAPAFDAIRASFVWYGISFLLCGLLVTATQLALRVPLWARWLAMLLLVGIVLGPVFARAYATQAWTSIVLYGGSGLVLVALPWLGPYLEHRDARSLASRLAVALSLSTALALIAIVTLNANREEVSLRTLAAASQQTLATALSHDVADYVELHEAAARALAAGPSLLDRSPAEQEAWLRAHSTAYPNVVVFSSFDAEGRQLARSDGRPLSVVDGAAWFERARTTLRSGRVVARSTSNQRPIFGYTAPVLDEQGQFRGVVAATIESSRIADQLRRVVADPSQRAYLVDSQGRTIAHPDVSLIASFADLSALEPVAALLAGGARSGSLLYTTAERDERLAGYARVPGLEWGVVVEQPTSVALASVRLGRERAFLALIVVVCLAAAIGAIASRWLTAPLAMLSVAVQRLADGASDARLGSSGITEISRLASAFGEMRERLAERTREHERSEAALRESEEHLRQALRARDEFLSIASHELRTPVTGIKGYAQLLLRAQARNRLEPARLTRSLQAIDEATDRLTTLTQDLLDVSRIRLGQLPLRLQEIDLTELVRRIGYRYSDQLPARHELIVDLWAPVPPIQGDADRLEQVLSNLLENAIKYSPEGGVVRLELGRSGDEIVLAVRDEGIGLPGDAAESIFRPFGRAPNASARNLPGMGLGLYICQNIVERHGGRIVARSAGEDLGTTFEITLPCPPDVQPETALEPFTVPAATSTPLPACPS